MTKPADIDGLSQFTWMLFALIDKHGPVPGYCPILLVPFYLYDLPNPGHNRLPTRVHDRHCVLAWEAALTGAPTASFSGRRFLHRSFGTAGPARWPSVPATSAMAMDIGPRQRTLGRLEWASFSLVFHLFFRRRVGWPTNNGRRSVLSRDGQAILGWDGGGSAGRAVASRQHWWQPVDCWFLSRAGADLNVNCSISNGVPLPAGSQFSDGLRSLRCSLPGLADCRGIYIYTHHIYILFI